MHCLTPGMRKIPCLILILFASTAWGYNWNTTGGGKKYQTYTTPAAKTTTTKKSAPATTTKKLDSGFHRNDSPGKSSF